MLTRTEYSFGECYGKMDRVIERAIELGVERPIICDTTTFGHVPFSVATRGKLRPIYGAEVRIGNHRHSVRVIARNAAGLSELYRCAGGVKSGHQFSDDVVILSYLSPIDAFRATHTFVDLIADNPLFNKSRAAATKTFPIVGVSDVRYPAPQDRIYAELLGVRLSAVGQHWRAADEMVRDVPDSDWTPLLHLCEDVQIPHASNIHLDGDLEIAARSGIAKRFPNGWPEEYEQRLQRELTLIAEKDFSSYFMMVHRLMQWARQRMLVGPGRGSSAGSIVCYLLGITELDPIQHGLLFERFVDVSRIDLPDIDMDFPGTRRDELFDYLKQTYGEDNVARLGNVNRFKPRSILGVVGKRMHMAAYETQDVRDNMIERSSGDSRAAFCLLDTLNTLSSGRALLDNHPGFEHATALEGHASHVGVHAAGVIVSNSPVTDHCAVKDGVAQIDKYQAEALNLMKLDALGLKTLDVVQETLSLAGISIDVIDIHSSKVYELLNSQKLTGIFQLEGDAARQLIRQFALQNFNDIVAVNALSRPGPLQSGGAKTFLDVRNGKAVQEYHHPIHQRWTQETEGVVLYQEQILFLGRDMGNLGWPELTALRRAMSKSLGKEYFDGFKGKFLDGAAANGVDLTAAGRVWDGMMHAGSYAFVKAHSASYSVITAWTAWLKAHHPLEFACATLRHTPQDEEVLKLLRELIEEGYEYVAFDADKSEATWSVADGKILGGLKAVRGIGDKTAEKILESRRTGKPLTPALLKKMQSPTLKWGQPYPIQEKFGDWYTNPQRHGIRRGWQLTKCNNIEGDGQERIVLGKLTEKNLRDAMETANIVKRGGVSTDYDRMYRYWLNITIQDDTGQLIATVSRKKYLSIGKTLTEDVPIGKTLLLRGQCGENGIRKLYIDKWKVID